jgi:iron complex outermembrane receptor protein
MTKRIVVANQFERVRRHMLASTALALAVSAWPTIASAQEAEPAPAAGAEPAASEPAPQNDSEIVVTGSRLRGVAPVGSSVISIGRDDISASSAVTMDKLIQEIPQVFDLGVSENSRGQTGGSGNITYGTSINLRGIGPYATLTIVDGHRSIGNGQYTDPSLLPSLMIQRVEVVADGASAIYGSDAIAGVVNLILRRNVEGVEVAGRYGVGDNYFERQFGIAIGHHWSTGQISIGFEHAKHSALRGLNRDFFRGDQRPFGGPDYRVTQCDPGNIVVGGVSRAIPFGGVTPANASSLVAGTSNRCEGLLAQDLAPEQRHNIAAATLNQEITPWLSFSADALWAERNFQRQPALFAANLSVPATNAFHVTAPGTLPTATQTIQYQFTELPADTQFGFARFWQTTGTLTARPFGDWRAEALMSYGENFDKSSQVRSLDQADLAAALASANPATAFDPYGLHRTSAAVLSAISDNIQINPTKNRLTAYELRANGSLFSLPGGAVRLAVGYEGQDLVNEPGRAVGGPTTAVVYRHFTRNVDSVYAELLVPFFGADNATTLLQSLQVDAAVRYDRYSDVGDTTNPKIGVNWSPARGLMFRGSYGTSFRAPLFSQLYGNSSNLFVQGYSDPTLGGVVVQGVALSGGNTALSPETATTWSAGADFDPSFLSGAHFSVTYFDVVYENQIAAYLSDTTLLGREAQFSGTGIILRGAAAAARVQQLLASGITVARGVIPNPVTLFVDGRTQNLGRSITRGLDFQYIQRLRTNSIGTFTLNVGGTYFTDYRFSITPSGTLVDLRNRIFNPLTFKVRGSVLWDMDPYRAQVTVNHTNGYDNNLVTPVQQVAAYTTVDLSFAVSLGANIRGGDHEGRFVFGIDVRNLFDSGPPYVNVAPGVNGGGGYDPSAASPIGRVIAASARVSF